MSDEVETQEEPTVEEAKPIAGIGTLVFGNTMLQRLSAEIQD